ncbi:NnrS family protein [Pseudoduganella sp. GCM10020061]|uniref:NnrS family protein n=1 Tax=Pseudoduganella sp. GCM10020061 TaxID=3317345 RepID=UPI00363DE2F6
MPLISIEEKESPSPRAQHALWALGFRPFYLLAAAFAAVSVPAWLASYLGVAGLPIDLAWHIHEMMFGFATAVVIGFLYTAGRNWTGLWTPRGGALAAIAALWLAGRVAMFIGSPAVGAAVDILFLPVAAWPMYRVLQRSGNKRNMILIGLLGLLAAANAVFHASRLGWIAVSPFAPVYAAIVIVVVIETVIGGRIIPNFTANAVPGTKTVTNATVDKATLALTGAAGLAWAFGVTGIAGAAISAGAAVVQAIRLAGWKPMVTLRNPLLWIMHASYAWIPVGFALLALAQLGLAPNSAAVHVLGVGAIAGLIVGMITRTALGHTGRMLRAGRPETAMFVLIQLGVVLRLAATLAPAVREGALIAAGVCWSAAFLAYLYTYTPYLMRARIDGKEG